MRRSLVVAAVLLSAPLFTGAPTPASAQSACRFDDSGAVCVCRLDGGWRIVPNRVCINRDFDDRFEDRRFDHDRSFDRFDDEAYFDDDFEDHRNDIGDDYYDDFRDEASYRDDDDFDDESADFSADTGIAEDHFDPRSEVTSDQPRLTAAAQAERAENASIQEVLNALYCGAGVEDGVFGPRTRSAIRCFQAKAGQPATGVLTAEQRSALLAARLLLPQSADTLLLDLRRVLGAPAPLVDVETIEPEIEAEPEPPVYNDRDFDALAALGLDDLPDPETVDAPAAVAAVLEDLEDDETVDEATTALAAFPSAEDQTSEDEIAEIADAEPEGAPDAEEVSAALSSGASPDVIAPTPPPAVYLEQCAAGATFGSWEYSGGETGAAVARAQTQTGVEIEFVVTESSSALRFDISVADAAYVQTLSETTQYLFIQTDQPAAIGFEDVSAFDGTVLQIPVGLANRSAMLSSERLTLAAAARTTGEGGRLNLFDLASVETEGLATALACLE